MKAIKAISLLQVQRGLGSVITSPSDDASVMVKGNMAILSELINRQQGEAELRGEERFYLQIEPLDRKWNSSFETCWNLG